MKSKLKKIVAAAMAILTLSVGFAGATGCGYCAHSLETIEKVPSTCLEHGHGYSYKCKKCNKLFAYNEEDGLYEIEEAEQLPLSGHTLPEIANLGDSLGVRLKDGKETADSIWDYEVTYKCALCHEEHAVPGEHLGAIVPPNINKTQQGGSGDAYRGTYGYDNGDKETGRPYTMIEFLAGVTPNAYIELDPYRYVKTTTGKVDPTQYYADKYEWVDSSNIGAYQRFPLYIPFNVNETRYVFYVIKNTTTTTTDPLKIEWSIDGDEWANVTVNPGEIKVLPVKATSRSNINVQAQFVKVSNPNNASRLGKKMSIEIAGQFYIAGEVAKLDIDNQPVKTEYTAGETFDPTGLKIYATYTDYCLGKTLRIEDMEFSCGDRPLTADDTKVTVSYGGKKVSMNITVTEGANNG